MIQLYFNCNGCGRNTSYRWKHEKPFNVVTVDLTNYVLFDSGFKMKEPHLDLHFCDKCFSEVSDGAARVRDIGETEVMRKKIEYLENELTGQKREFESYRVKIANLIKAGETASADSQGSKE